MSISFKLYLYVLHPYLPTMGGREHIEVLKYFNWHGCQKMLLESIICSATLHLSDNCWTGPGESWQLPGRECWKKVRLSHLLSCKKGGMISRWLHKSFLMHYQLFWRSLLKDKTVIPVESDNYFRQAITWELVKGSDATNVWKKGAKTVFLQKRYWRASVTGKRLTETLSKKLGANSKTASEEIAWATATRLWEK